MRDVKCKPKAKCRALSQAAMGNEQALPSTEKICLERCLKGCALQVHRPLMTHSFTDPRRTSIYEGSTAGHMQSDTCLFTPLARFSPAVCVTVPPGFNSKIQHLNTDVVRKNQVMGSFCRCPSGIHLTESDKGPCNVYFN